MEKTEKMENGGNGMEMPVEKMATGMEKPDTGMEIPPVKTESGMEKPVEKVATPVVKPVEKTATPPVKMAMEKSENLDDITHDFQQTGFNIHPMLIVMVFGIIIFIGILFFRNSRKGKELVEKVVKPKPVQTAPPRRPAPAAIKPQSNFTRNSALVGGII